MIKTDKLFTVIIMTILIAVCIGCISKPPVDKIESKTPITEASGGNTSDELRILGVDSTTFPNVRVNVFVNNSCAISGGLKTDDVSLMEDGSNVAICNFFYNGRASGQSLDLAVVFDDTDSMTDRIAIMKSKVQSLIDKIARSDIDARYALISFKDDVRLRSSWEKDTTSFKVAVDSLRAEGGDTPPENPLDAIEEALALNFRPGAQKVVLVITDAPAHQKGDGTSITMRTRDEVYADLIKSGAILLVASPDFSTNQAPNLDLKNLAGDGWINMDTEDFSRILNRIATLVTGSYTLEYTSPDVSMNTPHNIQVSISNSSCASGQKNSRYTSPSNIYNLSYAGTGKGDNAYGQIYEDYKVEVSKYIVAPETGNPGCQNVVICVKTPKIDFKPVTVFALDSSGSMSQNVYTTPMINGIGNSLLSHPNIEYARIDWDAQLGTRSIDPATGISPNPRLSDIDYLGKFRLANTWQNEVSTLQGSWRGQLQFSEEPEGTDYYVGLKEALDKIKTRKAIATHPFLKRTTAWQIVFVAGKSEFSRGAIDPLIEDALANGINISTIGIGIGPTNPNTEEEAQALKDMVSGTLGDSVDLNLDIGNNANTIQRITDGILEHHVAKLYSTPVIKKVIVTETLYKYLKVKGSSPMYYDRKDNPDGTTTLYFKLPDLLQNNATCITIYTELNFDKLPVDVSSNKNKPELDFNAAEATPPSVVSYETDMALERTGKIPLPDGELTIRCGDRCNPCVNLEPLLVTSTNNNISSTEEQNSTQKTQSGFEALLAVIGLSMAGCLYRRTRR
jgi:hypothetical protein